jgi:hypothetical protein
MGDIVYYDIAYNIFYVLMTLLKQLSDMISHKKQI